MQKHAAHAVAAAAALVPSAVVGHSWLECADYTADLTGFQAGDYDVAECNGFPRPLDNGARGVGRQQFGQDIGMDKQTTRSDASPQCHVDPVTAAQYGQYPMAQYQQGRTYTLAWPAKNHAAAECTNANIPDGGLKIFAKRLTGAAGAAAADPTFSELQALQIPASFSEKPADSPYDEGWGVAHVNGSIDMEGFQKCLDFCANTDKAFCHGDITIPADLPLGTYTMQWYWEFNTGQIYITCFDVEVAANDGTTTTTTTDGGDGPATPSGGTPPRNPNGGDGATTPEGQVPQGGGGGGAMDGECDVVPGTNMVDFLMLPRTLSRSSTMFSVELCYAATMTIEIVVEALDSQSGAHLGYGHAEVSPTETARERVVFVEMTTKPRAGENTVLIRAWNAEKMYYRQWQANRKATNIDAYELTRRETLMSAADGGESGVAGRLALPSSHSVQRLLGYALAALAVAWATEYMLL